MEPGTGAWGPVCPVCGRPTGDLGPGPCPTCGLPAAGQAAYVVARIGTTLTELARDRDALLASLRAAAPGSSPSGARTAGSPWAPPTGTPSGMPSAPPPPAAPSVMPGMPPRTPSGMPPTMPPPAMAPEMPPWGPPPPGPPAPSRPPRRRLSPQQVLLGLGALLMVTAALAFVAVAWTRLGLALQAGLMLTVTAAACGVSAWAARRGLRATEEALAAAGAALLAIDLGAARALGLFGVEDVPLRHWWAISCAVVVGAAVLLGRLTPTTVVWPLTALLAAQPVPFLLLGGDLVAGPAGVAAALALAAADVVAIGRLRPLIAPVARLLAVAAGTAGVLGGLAVAGWGSAGQSWTATGVLAVAGAGALAATRRPRPGLAGLPSGVLPAGVGAVLGLALAGSLQSAGEQGWWLATVLGLGLLTAAAGTWAAGRGRLVAGPVPAGGALVLVHALLLADDGRLGELAVVALATTLPAAVAAVRIPALRSLATAAALLAPGVAVLLAAADDRLSAVVAGLLLALLAALGFALAIARRDLPEERVAAAVGALTGVAAGATSASAEAWGQVGLQLAVAGIAAGVYAVVAGRRPVAVLAVGDLVVATWIAVGGAGVQAPEAYTLPAALGLLVLALPALRSGAPSWAAEGAAAGVALVPSALVVVADPTALRLVLVVAAASALVVAGTLLHRQAPFVIGTGALVVVTVGRLAPYAPLLPRWVSLGTASLLLLVLGATYERRRQQAREAVAWIEQMR